MQALIAQYKKNYPNSNLLKDESLLKFEKELLENFEKIKGLYTNLGGKILYRWIKKDIRAMAVEVGEIQTYDYVYRLYSGYVHCDITSMFEYYKLENGQKEIFDNSPSIKGIDEILDLSSRLFGCIVTEWAGMLNIEIPELFKQFLRNK
jgi:hypothetical protein